MTSRNFSFKPLLRHNLTSRLWAIALTVLGSLGSLLLMLLVVQQDYQRSLQWIQDGVSSRTAEEVLIGAQHQVANILSFDNVFLKLVLIVLATLCGVALFRYLHDRRQVDFFHAFPMNRGKWFVLNYVSGILLVIPVYLIILAITIVCAGAMGLGGQLTASGVALGALGNIAYFLLNYTVAVLCTVLTGNTVITVLLGIWFQLGLPVLMIMVQAYQNMYYATFRSASPLVEKLTVYGSPMCNYLATNAVSGYVSVPLFGTSSTQTPDGMGILVYPLVLTVLLGALSYWLFVRRKSEKTGMAVSFRGAKLPIKCFMCIFSGFAFSLLFTAMFSGSDGWMWFGLVFGVVLCHMVVEIIYDFDFKSLLHHWKQMLVLIVAAAALVFGIKSDLMGYDQYVPALDEIASAAVDSSYYSLDDQYYDCSQPENQLSDPASLENIHEIAELSVANNNGVPDGEQGRSYTIFYTLKNGDRVARYYSEVPTAVVEDNMVALVTSEAYLKLYAVVQTVRIPETPELGSVRLEVHSSVSPDGTMPQATVGAREDVQQVIDQLRVDQLAHAQARLNEFPVLTLALISDWKEAPEDGREVIYRADLSVYADDTDTLALIKRLTGVEPRQLSHENVQSVEITRYTDEEYNAFMQQYDGAYEQTFLDDHTVTVTDPAVIDALVEKAITQSMVNHASNMATANTQLYEGTLTITGLIENQLGEGAWSATRENLYYAQGDMPVELIEQLTQF